ncbi:MAG: hypothetical protein ACYCOR_20940 [Acidobacteriaceae bacterium]
MNMYTNAPAHQHMHGEPCRECEQFAEIARLPGEVEGLRKDAEQLNWLALHPRGAQIVINGEPRDGIFWGISSAPNNTLREAIDAARSKP